MATQHAPGVFFYVVALVCLFFAQPFPLRCANRTMVAQAGQPSGWPVFIEAGIPTPVWATTHKRRNFRGSKNHYSMEATNMAKSPNISHSAFTFIFAAVRRSVPNSRPCMVRTIAACEHDARQSLARDYVLSFAGRLPVREVA